MGSMRFLLAAMLLLGLRSASAGADEETWCTYPTSNYVGYGYSPLDGDGSYAVCRFTCHLDEIWYCAPGHTPPDCTGGGDLYYPIDWPGPPDGDMCIQDSRYYEGNMEYQCAQELPVRCDRWKH